MELPDRHVAGPFGISFDASNPTTIFTFSFLNMLVHSIVPIPVSSVFWVAGVLLYGAVYGFVICLFSSSLGCYVSLLLTRWFRPTFLRMLGENAELWHSLDRALVRERWKIPLLVRSTPVMPVVPTNIMLALTSIDQWTYTWTVTVGMIPAGMPYVYAAVVGEQVLEEWPPTDPFMLLLSLIGLVATALAVFMVGRVANSELTRAGVESPRTPQDGPTRWPSATQSHANYERTPACPCACRWPWSDRVHDRVRPPLLL